MHVHKSQSYVLEHYLRLNTTRPESWVSALQVLTQSPQLSMKAVAPHTCSEFQARLAFLGSADLNVCGTYLKDASEITGANAGSTAIIMPVSGKATFEVMDGKYVCGPWTPFVLDPHEDFHAALCEESHLLIIQLAQLRQSRYRHLCGRDKTVLRDMLSSFLYETPFFRSHDHALTRLNHLATRLYGLVHEPSRSLPETGSRKMIWEDRRLCKAIELLNTELSSDIQIESIASRAGLSLRNLHYLMKQHIGQSPYQYIRGRRLIKAREGIIYDYPDNIRIAEHAAKWGFQHAGRFSGYYLKHFGEYPNETLRELDWLKQYKSQVIAINNKAQAPAHYWISSAVKPDRRYPQEKRPISDQEC
ncbi:AraC family transcriptional regulator [Marinobacter sp.]|uniref:AraC family transcriptional regulator n=1 Tax=Marinobacter sp. TaxID=50741 RepID=UPI003569D1F6